MTKTETARIAAHWWAQQVGTTDDGTGQLLGDAGPLFTVTRRRMKRPTPERVALFESTLFAAILRQIESGHGARWLAVVMDWDADRTLAEALQAAGIDKFLLPMKTTMHISPDRIEVQVGEDGEWQELTP